jgi:hypothetical protein
MPKALANRLLHIEIEDSFASWKQWAVQAGINSRVLGFLSFRNDRLFGFDASTEDLAFPTPRSWEMVSRILDNMENDISKAHPLIAGLVGAGVAIEFRSWCKNIINIPSIEGIFNGTETTLPVGTDVMYATVAAMTAFAAKCKYDSEKIGNSLVYADRLPADFCALLIQNYRDMEKDYDSFLRQIPEYQYLGSQKGKIRNGNV